MIQVKYESNMNFIIDEFTYIMEDDSFYKNISSKYATKDVDFIMKRASKLLFIEAKSSSPKKLDEYVDDIYIKFLDSLIIFNAILLDRKKTKSTIITKELKEIKHLKGSIQLVLIIKNAKKSHLLPIRDKLNQKLKKLKVMFSLENDILVLNKIQAINKGFILDS